MCRAPCGRRRWIPALIDPVPGPSSTTTGDPVVGTTCAMVSATADEVGVAAPTMRGSRNAVFRNVRYSVTLPPSAVVAASYRAATPCGFRAGADAEWYSWVVTFLLEL